MRTAATLSSESLSPEQAQQLRALIDAAGFFGLPAEIQTAAQGADRFLYTVTVELEGQRHTVRAEDAAVPPTFRPLLKWLTNATRKAPRRRKPS